MRRSLFGWAALFAAAVLIVVLGRQNRELRQDRDWLTDRVSYAYLGMYVPVVQKRDLAGESAVLGAPAGKAQVLFFFDHTCPYCLKSAPSIALVARRLRAEFGDRVAMIGVCQCDPVQAAEYARTHGFDFPVVTMRERRELMLYRARRVPLLLAIDREGRVRHAVQGVFEGEARTEALFAALRDEEAGKPNPVAEERR